MTKIESAESLSPNELKVELAEDGLSVIVTPLTTKAGSAKFIIRLDNGQIFERTYEIVEHPKATITFTMGKKLP